MAETKSENAEEREPKASTSLVEEPRSLDAPEEEVGRDDRRESRAICVAVDRRRLGISQVASVVQAQIAA
jgi:hypothetical protein